MLTADLPFETLPDRGEDEAGVLDSEVDEGGCGTIS